MVVSSVAVGLIWLMILDPNIGPLNRLVKFAGLTPPMLGWLGDPDLAIWMFLVVAAWQYTGFMMVLVLAGLQGVPDEIYQAAALDGARGVRAFWYITLPSIRNVLIVAVLITSIGAFKVFDLIYVTTRGGPAHATEVLGTYIYLQAFNLGSMGYANTIAVFLLVIAVVLGLLQLQISRGGHDGETLPLPGPQPRHVRLRRRLLRCSCCCRWCGWSSPPSRPSARSSSTRWACPIRSPSSPSAAPGRSGSAPSCSTRRW